MIVPKCNLLIMHRWMKRCCFRRWCTGVLVFGLSLFVAAMPSVAGVNKIDVCHFPPDNPANAHIISIAEPGFDAHEAHGDHAVGVEICDGIDNDCNGLIDDGVADIITGSDVGECQSEIQQCIGGMFQVVQVGVPPSAETCDGLDNSCSGQVDDGIADIVTGTNVGECQVGIQSCINGAFQVTQVQVDPVAETCDGLDNSCSGQVDDGIADIVTGTNVGECQVGIQSCINEAFQVTQVQVDPVVETCDGLDNSCSGQVDDGIADIVTGIDTGECQQGIESCIDGTFQMVQTEIWPSAEQCDALDNDCDGTVDEDVTRVTTCGVGACSGNTGIETCTDGSFGGDTCDPLAGATAESCDAVDNDCDGTVDDGLDIVGTTSDVGECQPAILGCIDGVFGVKQLQINPTDEICDGLDNDCDGTITDELTGSVDCDDGIGCTIDACIAMECSNVPQDEVTGFGNLCDDGITSTQDICDLDAGGCTNEPIPGSFCPCAFPLAPEGWSDADMMAERCESYTRFSSDLYHAISDDPNLIFAASVPVGSNSTRLYEVNVTDGWCRNYHFAPSDFQTNLHINLNPDEIASCIQVLESIAQNDGVSCPFP